MCGYVCRSSLLVVIFVNTLPSLIILHSAYYSSLSYCYSTFSYIVHRTQFGLATLSVVNNQQFLALTTP